MKSIVSYENRGKWGNNKYRGNCTGHIIKDLLLFYRPKQFVEMFAGSGTGYEVAKELGYDNSLHLDLNGFYGPEFNALIDDIPIGSDFVFSHPPYHNMIVYSGEQWGTQAHSDDLSRCISYDEFIHKMDIVSSKIYNSLLNGGRHALLIGDMRKNGQYYSMIKDLTWYGDVESHIIKAQHNTFSERKTYSNQQSFIPIVHEHLIVFKKNFIWAIPMKFTKKIVKNLMDSKMATWRDLVQAALQELKGQSDLQALYEILKETDKAKNNKHYKEKIRQVLQVHDEFTSVKRGVWKLL